MADEGRSLITIALGLVLVLLVSGIVEGFVTPSPLPVWVKITIGALVLAGYWAYTLVLGGKQSVQVSQETWMTTTPVIAALLRRAYSCVSIWSRPGWHRVSL